MDNDDNKNFNAGGQQADGRLSSINEVLEQKEGLLQ